MKPSFWIATLCMSAALGLAGCGPVLSWLPIAFLLIGLGLTTACTSSNVPDDHDADTPDGARDGGRWDSCCVDGVVTSCFCPASAACNYGWYTNCGDGTCRSGLDASSACGDAGTDATDATVIPDSSADGGEWSRCCLDGRISTCFCPAQTACNYGWFTDCGDQTCEPTSGTPRDAGCAERDASTDAAGDT